MRYDIDESDYLTTYDPYCVEQHSDSSDFDSDSEYTSGTRRKLRTTRINMESVERTMFCVRSNEKNYQDNSHKPQYLKIGTVKGHNCAVKEDVDPTYKKHNCIYEKKTKYYERNYDCNNRIVHVTQSKLANMRNKVMPCLSSIFCPTKRADRVKENYAFVNSTKDNSCQVYSLNCNHKRTSKSNKRGHDFTVQSIYSVDEELEQTEVKEPCQLFQDSSESCPFSTAVTPSSQTFHTAKNKFRKIVERELKKYYLKKLNLRRNKDQQCPSKPNFLIYNSQSPADVKLKQFQDDYADICSFGCNAMPSSSSIFWEYLVDRISRKYQNNNRGGVQKTSHCAYTQQCPSMRQLNTQEQSTQNSRNCSCKSSMDKQMYATDQHKQPAGNKFLGKNKVHCKCASSSAQKPQFPTTMPRMGPGLPPPPNNMMSPCQEPHDEIKASLEKKYNGEILCIHNPPCILINGCLNLPPMTGQHSPSGWSTSQQTSYHVETNQSRNNVTSKRDCHNETPTREFLHCHMQEQRTISEKMTQSVCNHAPPCAVVRCCYKPDFDLKRASSCVHVPLCPKIPECLLCNSDLSICNHLPKCPDLPVCKEIFKKNLAVPAKENTETQVLPVPKFECRHQPPCIMIPRCLGRLMCDGYVLYEAIPSCVHRPPCDMIPACQRKSAKMVSVYCQYPAPCRIF